MEKVLLPIPLSFPHPGKSLNTTGKSSFKYTLYLTPCIVMSIMPSAIKEIKITRKGIRINRYHIPVQTIKCAEIIQHHKA